MRKLLIGLCLAMATLSTFAVSNAAFGGSQSLKFDVSALMHPGTWEGTTTGALPQPVAERWCITSADVHNYIGHIYGGMEQTVTLDKIERHGNRIHYEITSVGTGDFKGYKAKIVGDIVFDNMGRYKDAKTISETLAPGDDVRTSKVETDMHRTGDCGSS